MKRLAASFIVTVGISACSSAPPPTVDVPEPPPEPPVMVNPPAPEPVEPEPTTPTTLPTPEANDKVVTKDDGSCWVYPEVDCPPPPVTCNPPPPRQVQCPQEK